MTETEDLKTLRLLQNKKRNESARAAESPESKARRLEDQRARTASTRATESAETNARRLEDQHIRNTRQRERDAANRPALTYDPNDLHVKANIGPMDKLCCHCSAKNSRQKGLAFAAQESRLSCSHSLRSLKSFKSSFQEKAP